jgi:hypothetical protein
LFSWRPNEKAEFAFLIIAAPMIAGLTANVIQARLQADANRLNILPACFVLTAGAAPNQRSWDLIALD